MRTLAELKVGEEGKINSIQNNELMLKLMEMGCLPGENIKVEFIAPLGDPIAISVSGYQLSLRKEDAKAIIIENKLS